MSCTTPSLTVEASDEASSGYFVNTSARRRIPQTARRHSSIHTYGTTEYMDEHVLPLKVDLFLSELHHRLEYIESYGNLKLQDGIESAYATLDAVREACSLASGELMNAGQRRAKILVETLEGRYKDGLATKHTLEEKAFAGIRLLQGLLMEVEGGATNQSGLQEMAGEFMDSGRRRFNEGLERAQEVVDEGIERARQAKDNIVVTIESAIQAARERGLIHYHELPEPWRVNPYVLKGYRFTESKVDCLTSTLSLSNETVNIWSHLLGLVLVVSIAFYFYPTSTTFPLSTKADVFIAAVFFFAACKCLVCSTLWHTMNSIAEQNLMERFACVDYTGISLLIAASIMTTEYTAFYCEPISRWTYMVSTALLGIGGVILPWHPTFNRQDMAWARVGFYVALATTGLLPVVQLNFSRGPGWVLYFYAPIVKSLAVYLVGAIIYASHWPECWCPGMFDYFGGSHNIWHLAVVGGIFFHYLAMQEFFTGAFQRASAECPTW